MTSTAPTSTRVLGTTPVPTYGWGQTGATERGAQPGQRRSRLSRPAVAPTSVASPAVNAAGWVLGRAGVETDVVGETVATGAYWAPHTWQMARAAYVYDLDTDPGCPDAFLGWLHRAIEDHVDRGPQGRAELEIPAPEGRDGGRGFNRHHPLTVETRAALEEAIVADRLAGRVLSRSGFIHEAVTAAIDASQQRAGHPLQPVEGKLPNRPARRRV